MGPYILRRLVAMVPTWLIIIFAVVALLRLIPGSTVDLLLQDQGSGGVQSGRAKLDREAVTKRLGLDKPIPLQYVQYVAGVAHGDFGKSLWTQVPVTTTIAQRAPVTIQVAIIAFVAAFLLSIPIGVISAVRQDRPADYILRSVSIAGISIPNFAIGTALIMFPQMWFGWGITFGWVSFTQDPILHMKMLIPPAIVLGVQLSAGTARLMRTQMLEVLQQDYIRTARAKGLHEIRVIMKHAMKNAMIPVITVFGSQVAGLLGGSVISETIFGLPGLGTLLVDSINQRDYPLVQGIVVITSIVLMLMNLLVDVSYGWLDPRIRLS
jgi:peptide/nickel transport system permease protein